VILFFLIGDYEGERECLGGFVDVNDSFFVKFLGCTGREIDSLESLSIVFLFFVEFALLWELFLDIVFWVG